MLRRYPIPTATTLCFLLWLAGQVLFQMTVADTPRPALYLLNAANLLQIVALMAAAALLLTTNTRRPRGLDPDHPPVSPSDRATLDAFSLSTDDLVDHERRRISPETARLGRRATDVSIADIQRTILALSQVAGDEEPPDDVPRD